MSNDVRATFRTRCGCTQQIWLPLHDGIPPAHWQLQLNDPMEAKVDAEPALVVHTRVFKLRDARRNSWGFVDAEYVEQP